MALHMRCESVLGDGTKLVVQMHQCFTTKQFVVQAFVDPVEVRTVADIAKYRQKRWFAQYDNQHDASERFALGVTDELRRQGMHTTDWEQQLVNTCAKTKPDYSEGLQP